MKLNTLLLTSAATLMVTSAAFAADLPSKKAAPAAGAVQVCKVGGMTGFTVPGSDSCVGISGWVRANYSYDMNAESDDGSLDWASWGGAYRLQTDFRSNTEIGVVRGVGRLTNGDLDKAYIQFAGLTAGKKDSIADIFGTNSIAFGRWGQGSDGIDYKVSAGGLTFAVGAESPNNNNEGLSAYSWSWDSYEDEYYVVVDDNADPIASSSSVTADRPDLILHLSGSAGPVSFAVAAVSHQAVEVDNSHAPNADDAWVNEQAFVVGTTEGQALLGRIGVSMDSVNVYGWGGMAENASAYIGGAQSFDYEGGADLESSVWGLGATFTQGKLTLGVEYAQYSHDYDDGTATSDTNDLVAFASYGLAKGLTVTGEYYTSRTEIDGDEDSSQDTDTLYLRIQRDF